MKSSGKLIGSVLILILAGNISLIAQQVVRGFRIDTANLDRHQRGMYAGQRTGMRPGIDRMDQFRGGMPMYGKRGNIRGNQIAGMRNGRGMAPGMGRGMCPWMRGNMEPMFIDGMDQSPAGPVERILHSVPNVTEKQKKEIADLRQKQMDEMKKFREETTAKMKSMKEAHKAKMMNLFTEEQKKFLESGNGNGPTPSPAPEMKK